MVITPISLCTSFRVCSLVIRSCFDISLLILVYDCTYVSYNLGIPSLSCFLGVKQMFSVYWSLCVLESFIGSAAASCVMEPADDGFDKERGA